MQAFVSSINLLHCICMIIFEPFQFSDSKKGYWQKLKRNIRSLSQNHILDLVPVECFRQDIHQSFVRQKRWRRPHVLCQSYCWRSFAMTYHNSRVRRVNSFQTSLFSPKIMKFIFFIHKRKLSDIFYQNLYALQEQFQSSLKVVR